MSGEVSWEALEKTLASAPGVVAAWVFGSAQDGHIRDGGDLDVGVLFERKPELDDLTSLRAALQLALGVEEIDLVPLNEASSILRFEAVSGRCVFSRDPGEKAIFVAQTAREYEYDMAFLQWGLLQAD